MEAKRDANYITTLLAVSNADSTTPVTLYADPVTHRLLVTGASGGSGITIGTTTITSGTDTRVLFQDGTVVGQDAGFTYNKTTDVATVGITSSDAKFTLQDDGDAAKQMQFQLSGITTGNTRVLTVPDFNGTIATLAGTETFTNKTLTSPKLNENVAVTTTATKLNFITSAAGTTGTTSTNIVFSTSPTLVTPTLGAALATSINGLIITTTTGTLTLASGKTATINNTLTFAGTDSTTITFQGTDTYVGRTTTDTLTNKTLTSPSIASPTFTTAVSFGAHTASFTETDNGNSGTSDTIDWSLSNKQKSTLTGNCTFTFTAPASPCNLVLKLVQDGTGSRTVTWPAAVHWSGGTAPTLTTTINKVDIITFYYDGTTYFGGATLNFTA